MITYNFRYAFPQATTCGECIDEINRVKDWLEANPSPEGWTPLFNVPQKQARDLPAHLMRKFHSKSNKHYLLRVQLYDTETAMLFKLKFGDGIVGEYTFGVNTPAREYRAVNDV
jgi:hypothetical protein